MNSAVKNLLNYKTESQTSKNSATKWKKGKPLPGGLEVKAGTQPRGHRGGWGVGGDGAGWRGGEKEPEAGQTRRGGNEE